jgi:WD40 repeat protein
MAVLRRAVLAAILLTAIAGPAQNPCPLPPAMQTAPAGANLFNEQQEAWLGDAIADHIQRNFRVLDDPRLNSELERIGNRLLQQLPPTQVHYRYFVIDVPEINAFSIPGRVYVSRKLIAFVQNEDELAGIIAHELGHGLTHQTALEATARFRAVLGITSVGDRDDVYRKYQQYLENYARKPARSSGEDRDQFLADQVAIYALARADYMPSAYSDMWDRAARTQGKTGGWLSDLFGETHPEERRLRDMRKAVSTLSSACILSSTAQSSDTFRRWQRAVIEYSGPAHEERLPGLVSRESLNPPLQDDLTRLRFSPDGRLLLAQDEAGVTVLSKDPLAVIFHIDAPDARPAQFSPDSRFVHVYTDGLRLEAWDVAGRARTSTRELSTGFGTCLQTRLSPDGRSIACLTTSDYDLVLLDVSSGKEVFRKRQFYRPWVIDLLNRLLLSAAGGSEIPELIAMDFSPDSRYFLAGATSQHAYFLGMGGASRLMSEDSGHLFAFDLVAGKEVSLGKPLRKLLPYSFTFFPDGRLAGVNTDDPKKSGVVRFPEGQQLAQFTMGFNHIEACSAGDYLLVRPIVDYPVGLLDLAQNKLVLESHTAALDCYNDLVAAEQRAGQVALHRRGGNLTPQGQVDLPQLHLGHLRAGMVSPDLHWLALSGRNRGAIWSLDPMQRVAMLRAFDGAWFDDNQLADLDFPELEKSKRMIVRIPLPAGAAVPGFPISERGRQFGRFLLLFVPPKKDGDFSHGFSLEVHDVRTGDLLWSRPLRESPDYSASASSSRLSLLWSSDSNVFKQETGGSPALKAGAEKGDYLLQVFDLESGKQRAQLLIKTGKHSIGVDDLRVDGDWALVRSDLDTFLLYSLSTGQVQARFFGAYGTLSAAAGLASIENEPGQVTLYDLRSGEPRRQISLTSPLALQRFSADGKRLLLVTRDQNVFFFDPAASGEAQSASAPSTK